MVTRVSDLRADTRPIDKDVKVPAAVLRAAAAAEAAQLAAYPDQNPAPPPVVPPAPAGDTIVIAEPSAAPPAPQPAPQPPAPQSQPSAPVTLPGNEPPPQFTPEVELEMHRIRSDEGRKRAKLELQLSNAADRVAILENTVQELQRTASAPPPAPVAAPARLITPQEETEFGPEMLDVMARRAKETISPELAELRAMMVSLDQKVTGTQKINAQTARQTMMTQLTERLPEWERINKLAEFKAWLALPNPYADGSRHSALLRAFEQNDTGRVLNFFNGFISELAAQDPADVPAPAPATPPAPPKPGLESLAAPGRARTSAQPTAPTEKPIITTADVNSFYDAVRKGFYNGREAEKNALEQELFVAQREGRVRAV